MDRKVVLLGAGSQYLSIVLGELAITPELAGCTVSLYDINEDGLEVMEKLGGRIFEKAGAELSLSATTELPRALEGADFAISSIGVHGPNRAWHMLDCQVCARFGIMHTTGDTVGPAGISQGLRIIPIYMEIARAMEEHCPGAVLLNHSNPMAPICRAINRYTDVPVIGYCHNTPQDIQWYGRLLELDPEELEVRVTGPNHMCWLLSVRHQGRDVYPELKKRILQGESEQGRRFAAWLLRVLDLLPVGNDRHIMEFFPHARIATSEETIPYGIHWRAEGYDPEAPTEGANELVAMAEGRREIEIPQEPSPESMGQQIRSLALGTERLQYVNVPNRGAVPNLPPWAVLDLRCVIDSRGATPFYVGEFPPQAARWSLAHVYGHELLVEAAVEGSRQKALQALACDSMMLNFEEVEPLFDALVEAHGERLAGFRRTN